MKKPVGTLATVGVVLALVVLLGNAWISYRNTRQLMGSETWVEHTQVVLAEVENVRAKMSDAMGATRGFLLVRDPRFLVPYEKAGASVGERVGILKALTADNASQQAHLVSLEGSIEREFSALESAIALGRTGGVDFSIHSETITQGKGAMDEIRGTLDAMAGEEMGLLGTRSAATTVSYHKALATFGIATMAAVGLVVLSYLLIRRDEALRREAAKEQNRLANYNQLLIESTGDGIYGIDLEGNCTFLNVAGARILSLSRESVIGKRMHTLSHHTKVDGTSYPEGESPIYQAAHSGKGVRVVSECFWRPEGISFPLE